MSDEGYVYLDIRYSCPQSKIRVGYGEYTVSDSMYGLGVVVVFMDK